MRPVTLRNGLVLIVVAALLPIGTLSVVQALSTLDYSRSLIANGLSTSALATAASERNALIISKQVLLRLSENPAVVGGTAGCVDALKTGLRDNPAFINFARSDASGRVQCSILPFDPSITFAAEAWWQRGIVANKFTANVPIFGQISKKQILVGMQPITAPNGSNNGAVTVAIDASWLERSLAEADMSGEAAVAIIDRTGNVVLTSDKRPLPRFNVHVRNTAVARSKGGDQIAWMYAVAPLYDREFYVVYAEPTEQLMATAVRQVRINLLLPIGALLMASLAIWYGTNLLVVRWLESLRALAAQFARGDFAGESDRFKGAPRELSQLSVDLHSMAHTIEARDQALQAALDAKTLLTHDIHHRVKNNLQIVSSLLNLQAAKISDPAAREALNQTRARIGALAQIHRLLYEESHDSDHSKVSAVSLLTALCTQLRAMHGEQNGVRLTCDAENQAVPINSAVPLALLAVEAVTNAYRHGFPEGRSGRIMVQFAVSGDQATLSIDDDGVGLDPAQRSLSMGGQLMEAFAHQLGGVFTLASVPGGGTAIKLVYPFGAES